MAGDIFHSKRELCCLDRERIRTLAKGSNASSVKPTLTHPQGACCPCLSLQVPLPWLHCPPLQPAHGGFPSGSGLPSCLCRLEISSSVCLMIS